jgi:hypothetical protein
MIPVFEAAWEIHEFLTQHKIPYAIIGGLAVQEWGIPRLTVDVDLTVLTPVEEGSESFVRLVLTRFSSRSPDPFDMARTRRIVLLHASNGRGIDISIGIPGYEDELMRRAGDHELEPGKVVRLCSAEDLIIHKCVAGRPQDVRDVESVIARQGDKLDVVYIRQWLDYFSNLLAIPEVLELFDRAWRTVQQTAPSQERKSSQRPKRKRS